MDKFLHRFLDEWRKHGKIIVAVDFDDTIFPWKWEDDTDYLRYKEIIRILNDARSVGAYIVIFTASVEERFDEIREYCKNQGLEIDGINENVVPEIPYGHGKKIYANIFIDDRAGLIEALGILQNATKLMKGGYRAEINHIISTAMLRYPFLRVGQILFNLEVNEFAAENPQDCNNQLRDIYEDSDNKILNRMKTSNFYKQMMDELISES